MSSISEGTSSQGTPLLSSFHPKPGDVFLARWVDDGVYYRAMLLRPVDPIYSLMDFLGYGTGLSRSADFCKDLASLPTACLIDQYLQREVAYIARMRSRLGSAARMEERFNSVL